MDMGKIFYEKSFEKKILPEYFFHLEQMYMDICVCSHSNLAFFVGTSPCNSPFFRLV
jgi:hypothetical protein